MFHIITMWSSSLIILIMGGLLLVVGISSKGQRKHLRYGCFCLSISYLILGMAGLAESIMELSGQVMPMKSYLVIVISFFQAMLFTGTSLSLIRPQLLTKKVAAVQFAAIVLLLILWGISHSFYPSAHLFFFKVSIVAYVIQLLYYTIVFSKVYTIIHYQTNVTDPEGTSKRFYSAKRLFYTSLGIGLMALLYLLCPSKFISDIFTISYTTYYVALVFYFVNYSRNEKCDIHVRSIANEVTVHATDEERYHASVTADVVPSSQDIQTEYNQETIDESSPKMETRAEKELTEALDQWVKDERYLRPDVPLEEVANELNTDVGSMHDYFLSHKGVFFRTWRVMLRIEKAKQLLEKNPSIKISELQTKVGFSDKSYFFRRFKQVTGKSPNEYRHDLHKE